MHLPSLTRLVETDTSCVERRAHARDLWPRATLGLVNGDPGTPPAAVAWPRTEAEVAGVLRWAADEGVAVVPWGAGSGVCGAAAGREGSIALDLKRLVALGEVDPETRTVRVGPGWLGQHLEDALEARGWATRHSPSSIWCSTVGGWAASRSAGQFSSRYGKFEDMVVAARVASPAETLEVSLDGERLLPWMLGTEGALGVFTELTVRVVPVPARRWLRGYRFPGVDPALDAMREVMQAELRPAVLRLYDPVDTRLAGKGTATRARSASWLSRLGRAALASPQVRPHLLALPLALPRLVNALAEGVASGCVLIAGWEGDEADLRAAEAGHALLGAYAEDLGPGPGEHWYARRHEVSYKLAPIFAMGGFADTMEVAAPWSRVRALYDAVRAALGLHVVVMAHFSHAYREGCSIYFSFAGTGRVETYDVTWEAALAAAESIGATVAHHHGVGQLKMAAAAKELRGVAPYFRALKSRFDPAGVLNPGRLFPEVDCPEPAAPVVGVDPVSRMATLPAQDPPEVRDAWLRARGWSLAGPCPTPLAESVRRAVGPTETWILGASVRTPAGRLVVKPVPRSAAGPDVRTLFPPELYETLTVPVEPVAGGPDAP